MRVALVLVSLLFAGCSSSAGIDGGSGGDAALDSGPDAWPSLDAGPLSDVGPVDAAGPVPPAPPPWDPPFAINPVVGWRSGAELLCSPFAGEPNGKGAAIFADDRGVFVLESIFNNAFAGAPAFPDGTSVHFNDGTGWTLWLSIPNEAGTGGAPLCQRRVRQLPPGYLCSEGRRMVSPTCPSHPRSLVERVAPRRSASSASAA